MRCTVVPVQEYTSEKGRSRAISNDIFLALQDTHSPQKSPRSPRSMTKNPRTPRDFTDAELMFLCDGALVDSTRKFLEKLPALREGTEFLRRKNVRKQCFGLFGILHETNSTTLH